MPWDDGLELRNEGKATRVRVGSVDDGRKGVDDIAVQKNVHLAKLALSIFEELVIQRGIAFRGRFETIEEIVNDLAQGQFVNKDISRIVENLHVLEDPAPVLAELHDGADVFLRRHYLGRDERLLDFRGFRRFWQFRGVVDHNDFPIGLDHPINDARRGQNQIEAIFPLQALLDDIHVEQPEETATEPKAEGLGCFGLENQGSIVQREFFQGVL